MKVFIYSPGSHDIYCKYAGGNTIKAGSNLFCISKKVYEKIKMGSGFSLNAYCLCFENTFEIEIEPGKEPLAVKTCEFPLMKSILSSIKPETHDTFLLIVSDQKPNNENDTLYCGKLLEYIIKQTTDCNNIITEVFTCNVSDYDETGETFKALLQKHHILFHEAFELIRILGPGTPAMNFAGMCIDFSYHVRDMYTMFDTKSKKTKIKEVKLFRNLKKEKETEQFVLLLNNFNYTGAKDYMKEIWFKREHYIDEALELIIYRKNMNYKTGYACAKENMNLFEDGKNRGTYKFLFAQIMFYKNIYPAITGKAEVKEKIRFISREFISLMEIDIILSHFNELVAHLFTLIENLDEYLFYTVTGNSFCMDEENRFFELEEYILSNTSLKNELKQLKRITPDDYVKSVIFKELSQNGSHKDIVKTYMKTAWSGKMKLLRYMRNRGPLAHGFNGIRMESFTSEELYPVHGARGIINDMVECCKILGIFKQLQKNPYELFNIYVTAYIRRLS